MLEKSSFALIIPCYNETAAIPTFEKELHNFISSFNSKFPLITLRVVFVDNNSTDGSGNLLNQMTSRLPVQVLPCPVAGYGSALRAGFASQNAEWYGFADLDNTYPLEAFLEMIEIVRTQNLDIIYANRLFHQTEMPWTRHLGNSFYSLVTKLLFEDSMQDMCTGMRIFNKSCLPVVLGVAANGLRFSIELTALSLKLKWRRSEIPIHYRERLGESKLSVIKDGILFLFSLLKVHWKHKQW